MSNKELVREELKESIKESYVFTHENGADVWVIKDAFGNILFNTISIAKLIDANDSSYATNIPPFISYADTMAIFIKHEVNCNYAFFIRDIVMNGITEQEWSNFYCNSFLQYIIAYNHDKSIREGELNLQSLFKDDFISGKINELSEYSSLAKPVNSKPDFVFKKDNGELAIGEMKKGNAKKSVLNQIKRYMKEENIYCAFLIAKSFNFVLPDNIKFIKYPA